MAYSCSEDAFHSLPDFLDGKMPGRPFDEKLQRELYSVIVKNSDGTCGEKIYRFVAED